MVSYCVGVLLFTSFASSTKTKTRRPSSIALSRLQLEGELLISQPHVDLESLTSTTFALILLSTSSLSRLKLQDPAL